MRVAQIVKTPQRRGAETFALDLCRELERRGHETTILYLYGYGGATPLPLRPQDRILGTERPALERFPGFHPGLLRRLVRSLKAFRPAIVQTNGSRSVKYGSLARRLARGSWPLVARVIGSPPDWAGGALKRRLYARLVLSAFDGVIAVSRDTLEGLERTYGLAVPAAVIPRGVDPEAVRAGARPDEVRRALGAEPEDPVVLYCGSLTPEKRPDRLLRVFSRVRERLPGTRLWIAGSGQLERAVRSEIESSGLGDAVSLLGTVEGIGDLLGAADLLLLTSDTEGTPGVVLEAGLAEVPVVAPRVGGIPDCVLDGRTGLLAAPGDEEGLATAALELLLDPERRRSLGRAARMLVEESFCLRRVAGDVVGFYEERLRW